MAISDMQKGRRKKKVEEEKRKKGERRPKREVSGKSLPG